MMVGDPFGIEEPPDIQTLLDALEDQDCRTILENLEEPMTAQEISDSSSIPLSTTYRKLDLLSEASLVDEITEIRGDGHHTTRYTVNFQTLKIALNDQEFDVEIERPARTADEQLAQLWSEVRKET
jgi:predicted transcriptional regulator